MFRPAAALLATLATLAACAPVPVNTDGSRQFGETRAFSRTSGTSMNVTPKGSTVEVAFASEAPPSFDELNQYVQATTGCRPGALLSTRSTYYNGATYQTFALVC